MATMLEKLADEKLAAAARMWEKLGRIAWRGQRRSWKQVSGLPIGHEDRIGNVLVERGPGYFRARTPDGEVRTIWAPTPFI